MKLPLLAGSWLQALVIALAGCIPLATGKTASFKLGAMGDSLNLPAGGVFSSASAFAAGTASQRFCRLSAH
jgi:hypothetical protein